MHNVTKQKNSETCSNKAEDSKNLRSLSTQSSYPSEKRPPLKDSLMRRHSTACLLLLDWSAEMFGQDWTGIFRSRMAGL